MNKQVKILDCNNFYFGKLAEVIREETADNGTVLYIVQVVGRSIRCVVKASDVKAVN